MKEQRKPLNYKKFQIPKYAIITDFDSIVNPWQFWFCIFYGLYSCFIIICNKCALRIKNNNGIIVNYYFVPIVFLLLSIVCKQKNNREGWKDNRLKSG